MGNCLGNYTEASMLRVCSICNIWSASFLLILATGPKNHESTVLLLLWPCTAELLSQHRHCAQRPGSQPPVSWGTCWFFLGWLSPSKVLAGHITAQAVMLAQPPRAALAEDPAELARLPEERLETNFLPCGIAAFDWVWFCVWVLLLTNSLGQLAGEMRSHWMARYSKPKWQDYTSSSLKQMREIRVLITMIKQNCMCMKHA